MRTARQEIVIGRQPEAVFDFMLDFSRAATWRPYISGMATVDGAPPHAGSEIRMTFWAEGKEQTQDTTLVICDRPARHAFLTNDPKSGFIARFEYELEPVAAGTLVRVTVETTARSIGGRLLLPLVRPRHKVRFRDMLARLKQAVES